MGQDTERSYIWEFWSVLQGSQQEAQQIAHSHSVTSVHSIKLNRCSEGYEG